LLCGGDKSTQQQDIELAKQLDKEMKVSKWAKN
jgi:putative component of toxin-antitoxin plasmid stabilization module